MCVGRGDKACVYLAHKILTFWEFSVNWLSLIVLFPFTLYLLANHHGSPLKNTDLESLFTEMGDILSVSEDAVGKIKL